VFVSGAATGLAIDGLFNPVVGDQLYIVALLTVFNTTDWFLQMEVSIRPVKTRLSVKLIVTGLVPMQPRLSIVVMVYVPAGAEKTLETCVTPGLELIE
jgi:hypothetical protein